MDLIHHLLTAQFMEPLLLTLKVAGLATLAATILGIAVAYVLARWRFPGRDVVDAVCTLPMAVSYTHLTLPTKRIV